MDIYLHMPLSLYATAQVLILIILLPSSSQVDTEVQLAVVKIHLF